MTFPSGFLDELRARVSIAQVVGRKVMWDSRKTNAARGDYWAACPFHAEKSASFHVEDAKGFYYCFGCHAKGDALSFVRETENLGFLEAVELLAREAGLALPARDPAQAQRDSRAQGLVAVMEAAVQFYKLQLNTARAGGARDYLAARGLAPETIARFEIGYAPGTRTALIAHLTQKGIAPAQMQEAGLVVLPETGTPYDRFRDRIMFPIRDARGRAIAFGARALAADQEPKYLNSPETPLFDKSRTLFNAGPARTAAVKTRSVLVVEGYMDVIALAQAGLAQAVAPLGTAITEEQLRAIWRLAPEPVIALDGDRAGQAAAQRLIDLALPLLGPDRSLRFTLLPAGQDPDDVVRGGGLAAMEALMAGSRPMLDLIWMRETETAVLDSPERRAAFDGRLRGHLARIADPSIRAHWQAEIRARRAALFSTRRQPQGSRNFVRQPFGRRKPGFAEQAPAATQRPGAARGSALARTAGDPFEAARIRETTLLAACLAHPQLVQRFEDQLETATFSCPDLAKIRDALLSALISCLHGGVDLASLPDLVQERIGRDVRRELSQLGHVRANPQIGTGADPDKAASAIEEVLMRHAALAGWQQETRDAEAEISPDTADGITWRLRQATDAAHEATIRPLSEQNDDPDAEGVDFSNVIARVLASHAARKSRKR